MSKEQSSSLWPPTLAQRAGELLVKGAKNVGEAALYVGAMVVIALESAIEERQLQDNSGELIPEPRHGNE